MTVKFFSTEHEKTGAGRIEVKQVTKLNIIATEENPHTTTIERDFDNKFDRVPVEVLKMIGGEEGVIEVIADFDNSDKDDFLPNPYVAFDGTMHLKTDYRFETEDTEEGTSIYEFPFREFNIFGDTFFPIECIGVSE